jgi:hypothetical protein
MGMSFAVLASRTMAGAVRKYGLPQVEIRSPNVEALVCHQAHEMLAHRLAHDARLPVVDGKTFLPQDHRDTGSETPHGPVEVFAAGKAEVVRIAGISGSSGVSQPAQPVRARLGAFAVQARIAGVWYSSMLVDHG